MPGDEPASSAKPLVGCFESRPPGANLALDFIVAVVNFSEPLASNSSSITLVLGVGTGLFEAFAPCSCTTSSCRLSFELAYQRRSLCSGLSLSSILLFRATQRSPPWCRGWECSLLF